MSEKELYQELKEQFNKYGLEFSDDLNGYSIVFNEQVENLIVKLLNDFYSLDGCNLLLQSKDGDACICINTNDDKLPESMLLNQIGDSLDRYVSDFDYVTSMDNELALVYNLFKDSINYSGKFGIGFQNVPSNKKYIIKTDIPEIQEALMKAGFELNDNKVVVPERDKERFYEMLEKINNEKKEENDNENILENNDLSSEYDKSEDSKVDFYEKIITTAAGINAIVRLSIVKQDNEDSQYDRLVNISYISKETGVMTSNEVIGYEDAFEFDNNVLPSIIDGFQKNVVLSGKQVEVNEVNPTKCYLTSGEGENEIALDGYYVNGVRSLLDYNRQYNLVNDDVDFSKLKEDELIEKNENDQTFEGEVTDTKDDSLDGPENSLEEGPTRSLKLGEMPTGTNNHGLSNSFSLTLFLAIDIVAILVGLFLLIN